MGIVQGSVGLHLVCQVGGIGHKAVHKGDEPVSYTHLDVYKRQIFYYFGTALTWGNFIMIGADCVFLSYWLCWLVAIATAISGIKYL